MSIFFGSRISTKCIFTHQNKTQTYKISKIIPNLLGEKNRHFTKTKQFYSPKKHTKPVFKKTLANSTINQKNAREKLRKYVTTLSIKADPFGPNSRPPSYRTLSTPDLWTSEHFWKHHHYSEAM